jgi:hypothetical protein
MYAFTFKIFKINKLIRYLKIELNVKKIYLNGRIIMGRKSSLIEVIYRLSNLILRLVYINFLWILFSLLGLLIAGFFPSTVAMFTVVRIWVLGETDAAIFNMFWKTLNISFLKAIF